MRLVDVDRHQVARCRGIGENHLDNRIRSRWRPAETPLKSEAGANPARSRHCDRGANPK
jgi:hypothetical protein